MKATANHKIVVFFPTMLLTAYYAYILNVILEKSVIELHSQKTQQYNTKVYDDVRTASKKGGMVSFTLDVSARGVEWIIPMTEQAGKRGVGVLVLSGAEHKCLDLLDGLDIPPLEQQLEEGKAVSYTHLRAHETLRHL
eukprot:14678241-Ditylum_brightwellii.AAC.1